MLPTFYAGVRRTMSPSFVAQAPEARAIRALRFRRPSNEQVALELEAAVIHVQKCVRGRLVRVEQQMVRMEQQMVHAMESMEETLRMASSSKGGAHGMSERERMGVLLLRAAGKGDHAEVVSLCQRGAPLSAHGC